MRRICAACRWAGRLWSLGSLAFLVSFASGNRDVPSPPEIVGLAFFPLGVAAGLVIAWWREGLGGALTLAGLAGFYAWSFMMNGRFPRGPWFLIVAAPGLLFLLARALEAPRPKPAG